MSLPHLSLSYIQEHQLPHPESTFPVKILQFGTGAFLRGFVADYIHEANRQGTFKGTIVAVGSTGSGRVAQLKQQDGFFTFRKEGYTQGEVLQQRTLNCAISSSYSAQSDWQEILSLAELDTLSIIVSNTTEAGLIYQQEDIHQSPPSSFPAKLTAFLYKRFTHTGGDTDKGFIILPCELLTDNGNLLKQYVQDHATAHQLGDSFISWLDEANTFCNTLVDRIVTGTPNADKLSTYEKEQGYKDSLYTVSEPYRLWAIEAKAEDVPELGFAVSEPSIIVTDDITPFRERKLRLLNGCHTISVALGYMHGLQTMLDCMNDPLMKVYIEHVMQDEILPTLSDHVPDAETFGQAVLDRFRNPFLSHQLLNISMQYTTKMRMRNITTLYRYVEKYQQIPPLMTLGFAAYLYFLKPVDKEPQSFRGYRREEAYYITDDYADVFYDAWLTYNPKETHSWVAERLSDQNLWDRNLNEIEGFGEQIAHYLEKFEDLGVTATLKQTLNVYANDLKA